MIRNNGLIGKVFCIFLCSCFFLAIVAKVEASQLFSLKYDGKEDLRLYEPFKRWSKVAKLDGTANLQLTGKLPKIDCATAFYPLAAAFVEATYPQGNYKLGEQDILTRTTSRQAFTRLVDGDVDILFAFAPSDKQLEYAKSQGVELQLIPIGKEAFVFFVNEFNVVKGLSIEQIRSIYSGEITNWQEVGGLDMPIMAFQRPKNSGSQTALEELMAGKELMEPPVKMVLYSMMDIMNKVADYDNSKNSLGYSFRFYATEMVKMPVNFLDINGVEPSLENIKNGNYSLTKEFYIITTSKKSPNVEKFIEWILSPQGQELVEKTGYSSIQGN